MALTLEQRVDIWADYQQVSSRAFEPLALTKAELRAAVDAVDAWIDANSASFNAALPAQAASALTAKQKQRLFMAVARKRFEVA